MITSWNPAAAADLRVHRGGGGRAADLDPDSAAPPRRGAADPRPGALRRADRALRDRAPDQGRAPDRRLAHVSRRSATPTASPTGASVIARDITDRHRTLALASRLQALTSALSREITRERALDVLLEQAVSALGADAGAVGLVDATGTEVELLGTKGHSEAGLAPWQSFPLDADLPMSVAIRTGEGVWTTSSQELGERFPALAGQGTQFASLAVVPLSVEHEPFGADLAELQATAGVRRRRARLPLRRGAAGGAHARARAALRGRAPDQPSGWRFSPRPASCSPPRSTPTTSCASSPTSWSLGSPTGAGSSWSAEDGEPAQRGRRPRRSGADRAGRRVPPALPDRSRRRHRRSGGDSHRALGALSRDRRRDAGRGGPGRRAPADDARARPRLGDDRAAAGPRTVDRRGLVRGRRVRGPLRRAGSRAGRGPGPPRGAGDRQLDAVQARARGGRRPAALAAARSASPSSRGSTSPPATSRRRPGSRSAATGTRSCPATTAASPSTIGDVAGRGVRAASVMGRVRPALRAWSPRAIRPTEAIRTPRHADQGVRRGPRWRPSFTSTTTRETQRGEYVRAGHPPALVRLPRRLRRRPRRPRRGPARDPRAGRVSPARGLDPAGQPSCSTRTG